MIQLDQIFEGNENKVLFRNRRQKLTNLSVLMLREEEERNMIIL